MKPAPAAEPLPAYLVTGDDPVLVGEAARALVVELVGDADAALVVEEFGGDAYELAAVVDAVQTPPFLGGRRVVVARDVGRFSTQEAAPLVAYLDDPLVTSSLVLVAGGGQISRSVVAAVRKVGHVVDASVPGGRARQGWVAQRLKEAPVRLDAAAVALVQEHLGDDVARLGSLIEILTGAYGPGARLGPAELGPFLGQAGSVAPWELTDAIDRGDTAAALTHLHRLIGAGGRHPLVVLASLHTHYARMLRLDGAGITGEAEAAAALGMTGSTFPARKALSQARRLGHAGVSRAIEVLAQADLAIKGGLDWPPQLVLEVLVARLSRLAGRAASSGGAKRRR